MQICKTRIFICPEAIWQGPCATMMAKTNKQLSYHRKTALQGGLVMAKTKNKIIFLNGKNMQKE